MCRLVCATRGYCISLVEEFVCPRAVAWARGCNKTYDVFISAQGIEQQSSELKRILMRSCFHTVRVQQLVSGFKSTSSGGAWCPSAEVKRVVESRSRCIISSGLVEVVHNFQKQTQPVQGVDAL